MSSTNRGAKRKERDFYETPSWCTEILIPEIVWGDAPSIWEPAAGCGAILDVISRNIPCQYLGTDIEPRNGHIQKDFLETDVRAPRRKWDFIITNPPFSLAQPFIDKATQIANCTIMLLPLNFMGSAERHEWWKAHTPTGKGILSRRPGFAKNKDGKWGTDSDTYAWFIWDKTGRQRTGDFFLNPTDDQYKRSVAEHRARIEARERELITT